MPSHGSHDIDRCYQLLSFFHLWDVLQDGKSKVFECWVGALNRCRQAGPPITVIPIKVGSVSNSKESCRLARETIVPGESPATITTSQDYIRDPAGACSTENASDFVERGTTRHYVVHDQQMLATDSIRNRDLKSPGDVALTLRGGEHALLSGGSSTTDQAARRSQVQLRKNPDQE